MLQCVVVCCSELAVAVCWKSLKTKVAGALRCIAVCRSVLQVSQDFKNVAVCCSVLQVFHDYVFPKLKCVAVCCMSLQTKSWLETSQTLVNISK